MKNLLLALLLSIIPTAAQAAGRGTTVAVPAITAASLTPGSVTTVALGDGSVTTSKLHAEALDPSGDLLLQASDGNVGIGTTNPLSKLDLNDGTFLFTDPDMANPITDFFNATEFGRMEAVSGTSGGLILNGYNATGTFAPMIISGYHGSNTPLTGFPSVQILGRKSDGGTTFAPLGDDDTLVNFSNSGSIKMVVMGDGDVGIGTTDPLSKLHIDVGGTSPTPAASQLVINNNNVTADETRISMISGDTGQSSITFGETSDSLRGQIQWDASADAMNFRTGNNALAMTIDSGGTINIAGLASTYAGGSAFVCVNDAGNLFASEAVCP